eukprot:751763-Hanusia_phi.AAC.1
MIVRRTVVSLPPAGPGRSQCPARPDGGRTRDRAGRCRIILSPPDHHGPGPPRGRPSLGARRRGRPSLGAQ